MPERCRLIWLTPEQGGREIGPPTLSDAYASIAFIPPHTIDDGVASFVLRRLEAGAWASQAEGRWLVTENAGAQFVQPGTVVVVCEGRRIVAYFTVKAIR